MQHAATHCNTLQHTAIGATPLFVAASNSRNEIVAMLLQAGSLKDVLCQVLFVLQCVAVCCSVLQCVAVCCNVLQAGSLKDVLCQVLFVLQCVAVCCSVLQCVAVCCSVLL